jgi:hypothetical protein
MEKNGCFDLKYCRTFIPKKLYTAFARKVSANFGQSYTRELQRQE